MLVLSRDRSERLCVVVDGKEVWFTVIDVCGATVRIGIDAPRESPILREEIYQLHRTNEDASAA